MRKIVIFLVLLLLNTSVLAGQFSHGQRELGEVILEDLIIKDEKIIFRVASGGCTDKSSFKVSVEQKKGISERSPHYVLTFERIKPDDCKALFLEGTLIEYDLQKDIGLKGYYTISITNFIYPQTNKHY